MKIKIYLAITILFSRLAAAYGATGDVLYTCTFESGTTPLNAVQACGGNALTTINDVAQIVTSGHDGGKAISYYYPYTTGGSSTSIESPFWTPSINKPDITVEYWEKFDVLESASHSWNIKSIRIYNGSDFIGGMMSRWTSGDALGNSSWNEGHLGLSPAGTLTIGSVDYVNQNAGYCTATAAPSVFSCPNNQMALHLTPDAGTNWRKIRIYIKSPSTPGTTADGVVMVWVNDQLAYTLSNIIGNATMTNLVTGMNFHPSDDYFLGGTGPTYHHLYDDITVYDGYVPPIADTTAPTTTISPNGGRSNTAYTVTITCVDNVGCASTRYCLGSNNCTPASSYTTTLTVKPGNWLCSKGADAAGNAETTHCSYFGWLTGCK